MKEFSRSTEHNLFCSNFFLQFL